MLRHFKIRYSNRDEYIPLDEDESWDKLFDYCLHQGYELHKVLILESPSKHMRVPLVKFLTNWSIFKELKK